MSFNLRPKEPLKQKQHYFEKLLNQLTQYSYDCDIRFYKRQVGKDATDVPSLSTISYFKQRTRDVECVKAWKVSGQTWRNIDAILAPIGDHITYVFTMLTDQENRVKCQQLASIVMRILANDPNITTIADAKVQIDTFKKSNLVELTYTFTTESVPVLIMPAGIHLCDETVASASVENYPYLYKALDVGEIHLAKENFDTQTPLLLNRDKYLNVWQQGLIKLDHNKEIALTAQDIKAFNEHLDFVIAHVKRQLINRYRANDHLSGDLTSDLMILNKIVYFTAEIVFNSLLSLIYTQNTEINVQDIPDDFPELMKYLGSYLS